MVKFKVFSRPLSVFQVLFKANFIFKDFSRQSCIFKYFSSLCEPWYRTYCYSVSRCNSSKVTKETNCECNARWLSVHEKINACCKYFLKFQTIVTSQKGKVPQCWLKSCGLKSDCWSGSSPFAILTCILWIPALVLFDLILYVPSTIFQLCKDGWSSLVEPVLS